jgi:hypothetical protein
VPKDINIDDEDDANIPEDENDHIDSVQLERPKSQIKILNKSFSQSVFDLTPQKKKFETALKILKVISEQKLRESQGDNLSPMMPFAYPPVISNATLTTSQY